MSFHKLNTRQPLLKASFKDRKTHQISDALSRSDKIQNRDWLVYLSFTKHLCIIFPAIIIVFLLWNTCQHSDLTSGPHFIPLKASWGSILQQRNESAKQPLYPHHPLQRVQLFCFRPQETTAHIPPQPSSHHYIHRHFACSGKLMNQFYVTPSHYLFTIPPERVQLGVICGL